MSGQPEPIERLDGHLAGVSFGHELIAARYRVLLDLGRRDNSLREMLADATSILFSELPRLTAEARRLRTIWVDQDVLDRAAAAETLRALAAELDAIEPRLWGLVTRQREIAAELRRRVED